ncbi:molybdenum cofactor biosynthesis protein MoaE [Pseudanabaena sp. PCC 6802]|uniref:molybdenum cofactor biosynthesis protein MoaE n=1 Tax=Pseudanabaena sp. PCC 6802 TaxID=118173 RepID=UPI00037C9D9E|nr:molybdenum cofactor biosynthesis protein MoaE [Pseudanabaena sp. PCC 6802]
MTSVDILQETSDFRLTYEPLDVAEVYRLADTSANGAVVLMSGMVREQTAGRTVDHLDYQAYEPMALRIFAQITQDIRRMYPDVSRVVIHHRLGKLRVGEISVAIAVGSPHRAEAFDACRYAIDALKQNAPIWKKEYWLDGDSTWVNIGKCNLP